MLRFITVSLAVVACLLAPRLGWSEDDARAKETSAWTFEATPYFWLPEVHGTTQIGDETASVDIGFSKIFDLLGKGDLLAGGGHFAATYDRRFSVVLDAFGGTARPSSNVTFGLLGRRSAVADLTMNWSFFGFVAAYRVLDWARSESTRPIAVDVLAGGRLMYFYDKIALRGQGPLGLEHIDSASTTWVDPLVGGRFSVPAGPVDILFRGDIGGFGVGSELAWNLMGGFSYDLPWRPWSARTALVVVYKAFSFDYRTGSAPDVRRFTMDLRGPALGLQFAF